jgi:hypothetical protein
MHCRIDRDRFVVVRKLRGDEATGCGRESISNSINPVADEAGYCSGSSPAIAQSDGESSVTIRNGCIAEPIAAHVGGYGDYSMSAWCCSKACERLRGESRNVDITADKNADGQLPLLVPDNGALLSSVRVALVLIISHDFAVLKYRLGPLPDDAPDLLVAPFTGNGVRPGVFLRNFRSLLLSDAFPENEDIWWSQTAKACQGIMAGSYNDAHSSNLALQA